MYVGVVIHLTCAYDGPVIMQFVGDLLVSFVSHKPLTVSWEREKINHNVRRCFAPIPEALSQSFCYNYSV